MTSFLKHRYHVLDGMRGIAALVIVIYHSFLPSKFINAFIAVDFFFILSGFVICHSYGHKLLNGMRTGEYIARRVARLFPMMALAILIGSLTAYWLAVESHVAYGWKDILIADLYNIFFVPYLNAGPASISAAKDSVFLTDGPLWSISFEMAASLLFIALIRTRRHTLEKICASAFAVLVVSALVCADYVNNGNFLEINKGAYTAGWLVGFPRVLFGFTLGMIIYRFNTSPLESPFPDRLLRLNFPDWCLYGVLAGMLMFPYRLIGIYSVLAVALFSPLLVVYGSRATCSSRIAQRLAEFLGWLSYPLYCLHAPVIHGFEAWNARTNLYPTYGIPCHPAAMVAAVLLAVVSALAFDRLKLQKRLTGLLTGRTSPPSDAKAMLTRQADAEILDLADPRR